MPTLRTATPDDAPELARLRYEFRAAERGATARGGTGSVLMEAALEWCRGQYIDTVLLWPTERSRTLYGRYGFRTSDAIMARATPSL